MPNHVQSPRAIPFLMGEYETLIKKPDDLTGKKLRTVISGAASIP
jgi:hypothetical protein